MKVTIPAESADDLIVMERQHFDALIRALESAGVEVDIVPAPNLQMRPAFDEQVKAIQ